MIRTTLILTALLSLSAGFSACASREEIQAGRTAQQAVNQAEDDARCREAGSEPGSEAYDRCRQNLSAQRARQAEIDYQKARDFDRVLGGLDDL